MKKLLLICNLFTTSVFSQHEADNWYFGYEAGITFSTVPPTFLAGSQMYAFEGCASLSDDNGNMLFYTDGTTIWSRNHTVMPNGTGLNSSYTCSQSALFIPHPGNDSLYFLFTPPDFYNGGIFCYSIVDLTLNNGYGDITDKNTPLFTPSAEKVTAVRHANGTDIWVIGHSFDDADFYSYLITSSGIDTIPVISTAGTIHAGDVLNKIGIMKASPCGDKIALSVFDTAFVELFNFDNATGIVSNPIHLGDYAPHNIHGVYGVEFASDGSRLYVTQENPALLVQYNLLAGTPAAIIASVDTIVFYNSPTRFGTLQLGPDEKIYITRYNETFLAKIDAPGNLGSACNFMDTAIILNSGYATHGLPNYMSSLFCPLNTATDNPITETSTAFIYPNPAHAEIQISVSVSSSSAIKINVINFLGQTIRTKSFNKLPPGSHPLKIDVKDLKAGMYFIETNDGKQKKILKLFIEN